MSGIIGSRLNTRGSGVIGSLGTDGQVLTSSGAGLSSAHENIVVTSGKVLQLISNTTTTERSTSSTSWVDGNLTCTITPASTNNKIVCMLSTTTRIDDANVGGALGIDRSGGASGNGTLGGQTYGLCRNHYPSFNDNDNSHSDDNPAGITYLDSPSVTTAVVYKFQFKAVSGTYYVQTGSTTSSLVVMEIEA
tara:strand:- start:439 stop:1014 length:576 start_codon:yes stop_codon:yes gene_type:complete